MLTPFAAEPDRLSANASPVEVKKLPEDSWVLPDLALRARAGQGACASDRLGLTLVGWEGRKLAKLVGESEYRMRERSRT